MSFLVGAAIASRGVSAIGKRKSAKRQDEAAEEGQRIAYENAEIMREENVETERRALRTIAATEGEAVARQAASGFAGGTNQTMMFDALVGENKKQFDWLQLSGETRAKSVERGADYQKMVGEAQADATRWSAVSDIAGAAGIASYSGVFDTWGGADPVGSNYSWMNTTTVGAPDPLALDTNNFNIFGGQ